MDNQAKTIDEVLEQLDAIIAESVKNNNHLGYFAYVYRRTTAEIRQAILDKKFEDSERMEKFDVLFANKYLDAWRDVQEDKPITLAWAGSFKAKQERLTILQHIILGMNAHINYDLGLSAAEFGPAEKIGELKNDFMKVNEILASLVDELQYKVGRVSRLMFLLDLIGQRNDEVVMNFSMEKARQQAWNFANSLAVLPDQEKKTKIDAVDRIISDLAEVVMHPPGKVAAFVINLIARFEVKDVRRVIAKLEADQ